MKKCGCGVKFPTIPMTAKITKNGDLFDGYWWNCKCQSTLFIPLPNLENVDLLTCDAAYRESTNNIKKEA